MHSRTVFVLAVMIWLAAPVAALQTKPPEIPAGASTAAGTITAAGTTVQLTHAYALGPEEAGGAVFRVLLTDRALPVETVASELKVGGQTLVKSGKVQGLWLVVDAEGFVRTIVPYIGDLRGSQMIASVGRLDGFTVEKSRVTGRGAIGADRTMGQGWSYAASWNAALIAPR